MSTPAIAKIMSAIKHHAMILSRVITLANNLPRVFAWVPDEFVRDRGWRFTTDDYGTASNAVHPTSAPFLKTPTSAGGVACSRLPQKRQTSMRLSRGQTFSVPPKRPHLVTNAGDTSAVFLVLQGIGEYDFVPLT